MQIRSYQAGDEVAQAAIFAEEAGNLPGCKLSGPEDIRRRTLSRSFDPSLWHYAVENDQIVGYCSTQANGRIGYPWCRAGHASVREPLFQHALENLSARGLKRVMSAYHASWTRQAEFFSAHDMPLVREMVNFIQDLTELPTRMSRGTVALDPLVADDVPAVMAMAPELWRGQSPDELRRAWLNNPYFPADSVFVIRSRADRLPQAVGLLVDEPTYPDPVNVDPEQPCFRLGAFGTEGLTHKRINGLFSLVLPRGRSAAAFALELMELAAAKLDGTAATAMAAQVPSDSPQLLAFYQTHFRRQAAFPVFERVLEP